MTAPFGIEFYSPVDSLTIVAELPNGRYCVQPPKPHPLFESFLVRATDDLGVVWVKGIGPSITNDRFGVSIRAAVDRIAEQLTQRYGRPRKVDFLIEGSSWDEPQDWTSALEHDERSYSYVWQSGVNHELPSDVESIWVGAAAQQSDSAVVMLEYASPKLRIADIDEERRMADLL